ncbi:hypothetical protein DMA15_30360 [Streptomyces sp. WAC 01529]|uniref:hypothetical protein n=1 Tax=Streptomyces sp. WAC 01529 TaxID=2203205 RepID=UPI000F705F5D|nr:hypothetical protein [Streptomyces sp. WAC 01529]AZM56360.1 hypothetical protein DMA15_30360 [Streptomyces sp. WAC 01529]
MPHTTSETIAERIENLYGQPMAALEAHADSQPAGAMLAALTSSHSDLQFAERNITFQLQRLRELASPEREIGRFEAGHLLDCARRIAESVATRDAHAKTVSAVLASLHRTPAPSTAVDLTTSVPPRPMEPAATHTR